MTSENMLTQQDTAAANRPVPRLFGVVRWFNAAKGYGFIARDDGAGDVFVHIAAVQRAGLDTLREGQRVEFEIGTSRDGRSRAENLSLGD